jgi:hypothetical protein
MGQVTGMDDKVGRRRQRVDPLYRLAQGCGHVLVGLVFEADMAVTDLVEAEAALGGLKRARLADGFGPQEAAADVVKDPGANPGHAFEEATAVDAIVVVIVYDSIFHMSMSFPTGDSSVLNCSNDADRIGA